jgi:uncharacterized protein YaiI (UPF0178 family)
MDSLRSAGEITGGPKAFAARDRTNFSPPSTNRWSVQTGAVSVLLEARDERS